MFLHDCVFKDASETELFIVGAGLLYEAAKEGRDRLTQAVLVIDETIACGTEVDEALTNDQCQSIIATFGIGVQLSADEPLDMERLRYGRVIVVTDRSENGIHIRNEVFRFLYTYLPLVLEGGRVFVPVSHVTTEEFGAQTLSAKTRHIKAVSPGETLEITLAQLN